VITLTLAFLAGILIFQLLSTIPALLPTTLAAGTGMMICIFLALKYPQHKTKTLSKICGATLLGFLYVFLHAQYIDRWQLPPRLEKQNILLTGYVDSLPTKKEQHISFDFIITTLNGTPIAQRPKVHLTWYKQHSWGAPPPNSLSKSLPNILPNILAGDQWQFNARLKRPHSTLNPGSFDYEKYLWQHQIRATGNIIDDANVIAATPNQPLPDAKQTPPTRYWILRLRQQLENRINQALANRPLTPMITALVIGNQSGINKEEWQIFRDTGTSYLMAIAGLHICLAAGAVFILVRFLWRRHPYLALRLPAHEAAATFGLGAATLYSVLSGFSIPTQRALVMLIVFTSALLSRRHVNPWHTLCLALFIVLLIDPLAVLTQGLWLSFSAVILIFYVTAGRLRLAQSWWRKYSRMQWAITLGLAPITLFFFAHASLLTFVANIIAMPGVCSFVVPLSILGALCLLAHPASLLAQCGQIILLTAEKLLELIWWWLKWLAMVLPQLNWQQPVFNWWCGAFAIVGVMLLLAPRGFCSKWMGLMWIAPLIFYTPATPRHPGEFWLSVLDVGQGLATVIRTSNHVLVYDTGPKFAASDSGETIIIPFLQTAAINKIDTLIVSHSDDDHSGGVTSIRRLMQVETILASDVAHSSLTSSSPRRHGNTSNSTKITHCHYGQEWQWDGVSFKILHPLPNALVAGNDTSCVLRVTNGEHSIMLLGDIPKTQEKLMIKRATINHTHYASDSPTPSLPTSVVVAAHHGSATSSSPTFVTATQPQYVVFAAGYKNRFNFPAASVVERYRQSGATMFTTAATGALTFKFKLKKSIQSKGENQPNHIKNSAGSIGNSHGSNNHSGNNAIEILPYRIITRRYWHDS
jgi:competence protein ComEC